MKTPTHELRLRTLCPLALGALLVGSAALVPASAATKTWDGGGVDNFWLTDFNWNANTAPTAGDTLIFTGTTRLVSSNNFTAGTGFAGLNFLAPAGAFTLYGNAISLDGNITNNQALVTGTINLPLALSADRTVQVGSGAALTAGGVISGGFGLTKTGSGLLTLSAGNTFSGSVTNLAGVVSIAADGNLGTAPGAATPGNIVLNGGALRSTANLTLNANRGLALGPTAGSGSGRIEINSGTTLTYSGVIANNGGTGGLTKAGPGTLTLSSANSYTGPTSNRVGNLILDFTQAASPVNDIISSSSTLSVGGESTGVGIVNNIQVTMNGKAAVTDSQTFNGTTIDVGHSTIRANAGAGGTANLLLGAVTPLPGGAVTFTPPKLNAGLGDIKTASANENGILGGWATISSGAQVVNGIPVATNWATVDIGGNIVPYSNFLVYASGNIATVANAQSNLIFNTSGGFGSSVRVDVDHAPGAGTVTDLNTLTINAQPNFGINIGSNNTLRLGRYGGIFLSTVPATANLNYELGNGTTSTGTDPGANAGQNVGTLTAGGAPNTDGELVFTINSTSQTGNGSIYTEVAITDNGSGKVSVIKTGPGPMKFRGHNSFSGNMYILQGRIQMAGSELPGGAATTANPDAFGRGDIYVLPGGQAFPSGAGGNTSMPAVTNNWFLAGNGVSDNVGAIRFPNAGIFSNAVMTLIGDTRLGGGGFATGLGGQVYNKITGPFNLDFGATGNSGGGANGSILYNQQNDWTGDTSIVGRTGAGGNTRLILGNNEVIPDGLGKGNLILGNTGNNNNSQCVLDLNGFNETVNGLVSFVGNEPIQFIENRAASTTSTLTVGNNDASSTFGGTMQDNGGIVAITKIGGGALTLRGVNTYSGTTTVNGGTLAVSGDGSIASSQDVLVRTNAALDVSGVSSDFIAANTVRVSGGTIVGNNASLTLPSLSMTNGGLTIVADTGRTNAVVTALITSGATNYINITAVAGISGYPSEFTVIKYGTLTGAGNNFALGNLPSTNTVGYVSNHVASGRIVLVLLDGPKPLTWTGNLGRDWDLGATTNWVAFKGTVNETNATFNTADSTFFDDTGLTNVANLVSILEPGGITVSNETVNYSFVGSGSIAGLGGLLKQGAGTLTLANTGASAFRGGVAANGGTVIFATDHAIVGGASVAPGAIVQLGTNGNSGTLPAGIIDAEGSLVFSRGSAAYTVANRIGGSGSITKNDTAILTLSGANTTFTGAVAVVSGTLLAGNGNALGTADGGTTISSGATLDVGGQQLNNEPITVSGAGVGGVGAVTNSVAEQQNALGNVTLAGHTTFGGRFRYDIRGGAATLSTGGSAYNLTKIGTNQFSLVGVNVDPALANISVGVASIFSVETSTTSLGDPASTLTVNAGGMLQFFNTYHELANARTWDKVFVLNGNGTTNTVNNAAGTNVVGGPVTLTGACVFNAGGTSLSFNSALSGAGSLNKIGTATLVLNGTNTYTGNTTNSAGTLIIHGQNNGGALLTNAPGTTLAGRGVHTGAVLFGTNVTFLPGGAGMAGTFASGPMSLNADRITFDLGTNDVNNVFPVNDLVSVTGNLTLTGITTNTLVAGPVGVLTNGQIVTLFQYTGTLTGGTNNLRLVVPPGYTFSFVEPSTTPGQIQIKVETSPAVLSWRGLVAGSPTDWNIQNTTNWVDGANLSDYLDYDAATFGDLGLTNLVTLTTNLTPSLVTLNNNALNYTFTGPGKLTGITRLDVLGTGALTIANSGTNDFTGPVNIGGGALRIGDGTTSGNLGTGPITNNASLVFHRGGSLTVSGVHGSGSISNVGSGVATISGVNTYDGEVTISTGTVRAGSGTALGSVAGATTVESGATLDVNGQTLNNEPVTVSGVGVGGAGAILNNGPDILTAMGNVTLAGHTTFGGSGRWDIRGGLATLSTSGTAYNLTKISSNQFTLVGVAVDGALADIDVQGGTFAAETTTTSLGNPLNTLTLAAGATFQMFNSTTPFDKIFLLAGNGIANTINVPSGTANTLVGPITITGPCRVNVTGANGLTVFSVVGGPGSLTKTSTGSLTLSGTLSYTGDTTVSTGTLMVNGPALLTNSPVITVGAGALLDVVGLSTGPTLALVSGQTLAGHGTINGSVTVAPGATIAPGTSGGVLTITNDVLLQGVAVMELNKAANTNDRLRSVLGSITYGGALVVTNIGGTLVGGESFKLFDSFSATYLGSFSSIQLPLLGPGVSWNTSQLSVNGTISVTGTLVPPSVTSVAQSGADLVVSGTGGVPNGPYVVVTSANVALPLINWTPVATNSFNGSGGFSFSTPIDPNAVSRFYRLLLP